MVINKGKGVARNVRLYFPEGRGFIIESSVERTFPVNGLEPDESIAIMVAPILGSDTSAQLCLIWDDDTGLNRHKDQKPSIII